MALMAIDASGAEAMTPCRTRRAVPLVPIADCRRWFRVLSDLRTNTGTAVSSSSLDDVQSRV